MARAPLGVIVLLAALWGAASADVPMHNPALDKDCPAGFQWSRDTAACEQAFCPPGAGRVYTLECNCGEAWGNPDMKTCWENGMAVRCIPPSEPCEQGQTGGWDPMTGGCKPGFLPAAEGTCEAAFGDKVKCTAVDAGGNPIAGRTLSYSEYEGDDKQSWNNNQDLTTGADGTVEFTVSNHKAPQVGVKTRGPEGLKGFTIDLNKQRECVLHLFDGPAFEAQIKNDYTSFVTGGCLDKDAVAKVKAIKFDLAASGKPQFDPNTNTIEGVGVNDDYDELMRGMIHEISHGFIAGAIDPGKDVGGPHDNWSPIDPTKMKAGTAEQLAFEEGIADFIAMLYFHMRGQKYQSDLGDPSVVEQKLLINGKDASARTESMVTNYLWELYKPVIESGPGGAQTALNDFLQTMTYENRKSSFWSRDPTRTIHDFIAARLKRASDTSDQATCYGAIDPQALRDLSGKYGFTDVPKVQGSTSLKMEVGVYDVPAGGPVTIQDGAAFLSEGKIAKATFEGGAQVEIEADGRPTLKRGTVRVTDGPARTAELDVIPMGTAYTVSITAQGQTILVAEGSVDVTERGGAHRKVTIAAGQAADWTAAAGFTAPRDAKAEIEKAKPPEPKAKDAAKGGASKTTIPWLPIAGGAVAVLLILLLVVRRKR